MKRWIPIVVFGLLAASCGGASKKVVQEDQVVVQILQTSDLHGKFINYEYAIDEQTNSGGLAAIATLVEQLRKEHKHTILLDTGDTFQDNYNELFISTPAQNPMVLAMNKLKYDAMTVGNHEFNFGVPYLQSLEKELKMPVLGGNVYDQAGQRLFKPYVILNKGGLRVAVVGMVTPNISRWDADHLKNYEVTMPVAEMALIWQEIADEADLFVFANHMAWADEYQVGDGYETLLSFYPQFDLALVAHEHSPIARFDGRTIVLEPEAKGNYLSRALFTYEKDSSGKYQLVDRSYELISMRGVEDHPDFVKLTQAGHQKALADAHTVIGRLQGGPLVPESPMPGVSLAQLQPTAMIALINEAQRFYTNADVSSAALFTLDANMQPGDITKAGVAHIYKYDNTLRVYEMSGAQLKEYMQWSAQYFNQFQNGDLTISFNPQVRIYNYDMFGGVLYDIDISQPAGSRIGNVRWPDGSVVADDELLTIAVNDYRAKTTLLSDLFPNGEIRLVNDLYEQLGDDSRIRTLIGRYIMEQKNGLITNDFDTTEHNYRLIGYQWDEQLHDRVIELVRSGDLQLPKSEDGRTPNVKSLTVNDLI